jgi:hypothetical protein
VHLALALLLAIAVAAPASADAGDRKKAIWGPSTAEAFRLYDRLDVGIYESRLIWSAIAPARPANPADPHDPAYSWPADLDAAVRRAEHHGMRLMLMIHGSPRWANGDRGPNWAPHRAADLAAFATAASLRYPGVRLWMIWGEPTRQPNFMPLPVVAPPDKPLTRREQRAPQKYARMLDASYGALKAVSPENLVIGGNSYTTGDIGPLNWVRGMRLRDGRRPRMDMYGHNPFTLRYPNLNRALFRPGNADFSDLDALMRWLDRYGYRDTRGRRMRIFISEWTLPTDHFSHEFNFWMRRDVAARWLCNALGIVRAHRRLYTLGWHALYDDAPRRKGDEVNRGLLTHRGKRKPAFGSYRRC